jgi:hypothetical protein
MTGSGRVMAYQQTFRTRVARDGVLATAPVSVAFLVVTLAVSAAWRDPTAWHRTLTACCAWQAADLRHGPMVPLVGSAFLVRRPVEAAWTVAATWLVLGPLEAVVGSRRMLVIGGLGHVGSTVLIDLCWLARMGPGGSLAGLDVGTSAVVVAGAAALAVSTRSLPVAMVLAVGLAIDLAAARDLANVEHLVAAAIGVGGALVHLPGRWPRWRPELTGAAGGGRPRSVPSGQGRGAPPRT